MSWRSNKRVAAGAEAGGKGWDLRSSTRWNAQEGKRGAGLLRLVDFGFYFKWMGTLLVHFWPGEYNPEEVFTKISMAALYKRSWRCGTLRQEELGVEALTRSPRGPCNASN